MAVPSNILQNVQTYQKAELAWMYNSFYGIKNANKKFKEIRGNDPVANLGDTVTFDKAPRFQGYPGLIITQQASNQRVQSLSVTQAYNISSGYTDQQFLFNVEVYMDRFGESAALELGSLVEADILQNFISGVTINDPQNPNVGTIQTASGPYRFFGNGTSPINSYGQLAQAVANFTAFGCNKNKRHAVLPVDIIPSIINNGLNQFATSRNDKDAEEWELGDFAGFEWFTSNLLPTHVSGTIGNTASPNNVMTVVSTNDPTGFNVTQITFTEPTSGTDPNAVQAGDMFQFVDNISGKTNVRFLTFIGHKPTVLPYQFRSTAQAATTAGSVTVTLSEPLCWQPSPNQNCNTPIVAGMEVIPVPTHRGGILHSGDQFYLAMPVLPDERPFDTVTMMDEESGASLRHYFGSQFGQNNRAYVRDEIHGSTMVPENSLRLIFPA